MPFVLAVTLLMFGFNLQAREICFPGADNPLCLQLQSRQSMSQVDRLAYQYKQPNSANRFPSSFSKKQYRKPIQFADIRSSNGSEAISINFNLEDFMALFKGPYGMFSPAIVKKVQAMRDDLGGPLIVNSAYRGPKYNASIGGATWSRHMYGDALDLSMNSATDLAGLKKLCLKFGASFFQLYATHVHCDWRNHPLEEKFFGPGITEKLDRPISEILAEMSSLRLIRNKNTQRLSVVHPEAEDGADLLYFWQIEHQNGTEKFESTSSDLNLPLEMRLNKVKVLIGGSIAVEQSF